MEIGQEGNRKCPDESKIRLKRSRLEIFAWNKKTGVNNTGRKKL
jgi:hypothetical protein